MGSRRFTTFGLGCLLGVASCGSPGEPVSPTQIRLLSGEGHTVPAGYPVKVVVEVSNDDGPLAGVSVVFRVASGGGTVAPTTRTTSQSGQAWVVWATGGALGEQRLDVSAGPSAALSVALVVFTGPPARITAVDGDRQYGVVNRPVPFAPTVRLTDAFGNPVVGQVVSFRVTEGGGHVADSLPVTSADGVARLGIWTLGPGAGVHRLRAWSKAGWVDFVATGIPASLSSIDGVDQTVNSGTAVPIPPTVLARDADGAPLPGVPVAFLATSGNGTVTGGTQSTDSVGEARPERWVLDLAPRPNFLVAQSPGMPDVTIWATGVKATPHSLRLEGGAGGIAIRGNFLQTLPSVLLVDTLQQPVAGYLVRFEARDEDAWVISSAALTDSDGLVGVGAWRLGPGLGPQRVDATAEGVPGVVLEAEATVRPPSEFSIAMKFVTPPLASHVPAFERAVKRWESIVVGDLPGSYIDRAEELCPAVSEYVDDVLIFMDLNALDGKGDLWGRAGPCLSRAGSQLPLVGRVTIDTADLRTMDSLGLLETLIIHEIGHVLGIGTRWAVAGPSSDPFYAAPLSRAAYAQVTGATAFVGVRLPIENTGGPGTWGAHWRESVFGPEIMTGWINRGINPLSAVTAAALRDLGYLADDSAADEYSLPALLQGLGHESLQIREAPLPGPPRVVTPDGR